MNVLVDAAAELPQMATNSVMLSLKEDFAQELLHPR